MMILVMGNFGEIVGVFLVPLHLLVVGRMRGENGFVAMKAKVS